MILEAQNKKILKLIETEALLTELMNNKHPMNMLGYVGLDNFLCG